MGFWDKFRTFFFWGLDFLRTPEVLKVPIVQVMALVSLASLVVCVMRWQQTKKYWKGSNWLVLTQLLFYPLIIAVGAGFTAHTRTSLSTLRPNQTGERLLDVLAVASLATACFWVCRMKGARWLTLSLVLFQEIVLLGAMFVAGMAVSGDWI
jgi:hypothetical protein